MTALATCVPRTCWATAAPSVAWLKPASVALSLGCTETRGTLCARSLWTSLTSLRLATAWRTCSEAFFRTSASAALTTTLRSWLPKPPPVEMAGSPGWPLRAASRRSCALS